MGLVTRNKRAGVFAASAIMLGLTCVVAMAEETGADPSLEPQEASAPQSITDGVVERVRASLNGENWREQPDHVLYRLSEQKWNRLLRDALNLPNWVELSAQQRTRFESVSHPWRRGQLGQTDVQIPQRTNVRLGVTRGPFALLFEGIDSRTNGQQLPNDFNGSSLVNHTDILQLFASGTFRDTFGSGLRTDIHVGRFTFEFGSVRLIGRNLIPNVTNAFDGVHLNIGKESVWRVRGFLVEPRLLDPLQLDEQSAKSTFWGTIGEFKQQPWMITEPYYLGINDQVRATRRTFSTFGLRLHKKPAAPGLMNDDDDDDESGTSADILNGVHGFDYELETAVQTGTRGQNDFFAYMGHAELGYTFNAPWRPRFVAQYDYSSGTRTPGGSQNQTFDSLFGLRRFDMMITANFGPFFRSNINGPGWRVVVKPRENIEVFLKQRFWYLAQGKDAFVQSNQPGFAPLQDPTGNSGNYLGHDLELTAIWRVSSNLTLEAVYDHWSKGSYFDRLPVSAGLPPGGNKDTDYFYLSMHVRL
ncbi:MAG TPA: alginate export family protein [Nitrospira sp.]